MMPAVPVDASKADMFFLSGRLRQQLISEARAAFPNECCGVIEGVRREGIIEALRLHPSRNLATRTDRFEIDPMEQFRLLHALRGTERDIIGCYHSHPDGAPVPSAFDLEMAAEEDFVWLIAAVDPNGAWAVAAHLFAAGAFRPLRMD